MAGAGYHLFVAGAVLTAVQVNTLLNQQSVMVFATAAARDAALVSVKSEGMFAYLLDVDLLTMYNSAGVWVPFSQSVLGVHSSTTSFSTTGTHTTFQDEGLTLTLTPPGGRRWKFTLIVQPVATGGTNPITYRLLAGGVTLRDWTVPPESTSTAYDHAQTLMHTQILVVAGSTVFKVQIKGTANTAVTSFAAAGFMKQLVIEDIGAI